MGYFLKMGERPTRAKLVENLDWKCKGKFNLLVLSLVFFFFPVSKLLRYLKVFKLLLVSVESSHRRSSYLYMHQKSNCADFCYADLLEIVDSLYVEQLQAITSLPAV